MKGGKGGQGRKRAPTKVAEKQAQRGGVKKGSAKRDWGAMPNDGEAPVVVPAKGPAKGPRGGRLAPPGG